MSDHLLTAKQAADLIDVSLTYIRTARVKGLIGFTQVGKKFRYSQTDVLNLVRTFEPHKLNDNINIE